MRAKEAAQGILFLLTLTFHAHRLVLRPKHDELASVLERHAEADFDRQLELVMAEEVGIADEELVLISLEGTVATFVSEVLIC